MAGARLIIERFANITDGSVIGVRAPYLLVGADEQFSMMSDQVMRREERLMTVDSHFKRVI